MCKWLTRARIRAIQHSFGGSAAVAVNIWTRWSWVLFVLLVVVRLFSRRFFSRSFWIQAGETKMETETETETKNTFLFVFDFVSSFVPVNSRPWVVSWPQKVEMIFVIDGCSRAPSSVWTGLIGATSIGRKWTPRKSFCVKCNLDLSVIWGRRPWLEVIFGRDWEHTRLMVTKVVWWRSWSVSWDVVLWRALTSDYSIPTCMSCLFFLFGSKNEKWVRWVTSLSKIFRFFCLKCDLTTTTPTSWRSLGLRVRYVIGTPTRGEGFWATDRLVY